MGVKCGSEEKIRLGGTGGGWWISICDLGLKL